MRSGRDHWAQKDEEDDEDNERKITRGGREAVGEGNVE